MGFFTEHGDAILAAGAGLLGALTAVPMEWARRKHDDQIAKQNWRRDHRHETFVALLAAGRDLHRQWETAYENLRRDGVTYAPGYYHPMDAVEAAFTKLMTSLDAAHILSTPDAPLTRVFDDYTSAAHTLVVTSRQGTFFDELVRRSARSSFLDATAATQSVARQTITE